MPSAFDGVYEDMKGVEGEVNGLIKECNSLVTYWSGGEFDRSAAEMLADAKNAIKLYTARDAVLKAAKAAADIYDQAKLLIGISAMGRIGDDLDNLNS